MHSSLPCSGSRHEGIGVQQKAWKVASLRCQGPAPVPTCSAVAQDFGLHRVLLLCEGVCAHCMR